MQLWPVTLLVIENRAQHYLKKRKIQNGMKSGGEILLAQFQQMAHGSARSFCFGGLIEVKKVYVFNTLSDLNSNTPLTVVEIQQNYECEMHSVAAAGEGGGHGRCQWQAEGGGTGPDGGAAGEREKNPLPVQPLPKSVLDSSVGVLECLKFEPFSGVL
jgi:hypothetical protein